MGNDPGVETWGLYLKRMTSRDGWTVARLGREADINPSTIFDYIRYDSGESVKAETILRIARALGDDPAKAFRAAAGIAGGDPEDDEIVAVLETDLDDDGKQEIIEDIRARRQRDRERRMQDTIQMIRWAGGKAS